jgi:predicted tellurium resistance membrane protein TerC
VDSLLSIENWFTLAMLIALQAVLGFDNLLYISIESKRAPEASRAMVRRLGIALAIVLRIILLYVVLHAIELFQDRLFTLDLGGLFRGEFNGHSLIVLFGGGFIMYTAVKEISHMLSVHHIDEADNGGQRSVASVIAMIVAMNLVFSFDSILSTIALTGVFWVMATAIIVTGILMIALANSVAEFLKRNRLYEVLGLFILFIVGLLLVSEGGHLAHIELAGYPVTPMTQSTFYFVLIVLVVVDIVQTRFQKRLLARKEREISVTAIKAGAK